MQEICTFGIEMDSLKDHPVPNPYFETESENIYNVYNYVCFKQKNCVKMRHLDKHDVCLLSEAYFVLSHKSFLLFKNN